MQRKQGFNSHPFSGTFSQPFPAWTTHHIIEEDLSGKWIIVKDFNVDEYYGGTGYWIRTGESTLFRCCSLFAISCCRVKSLFLVCPAKKREMGSCHETKRGQIYFFLAFSLISLPWCSMPGGKIMASGFQVGKLESGNIGGQTFLFFYSFTLDV